MKSLIIESKIAQDIGAFLTEYYLKADLDFSFKDDQVFVEKASPTQITVMKIQAEAFESGFQEGIGIATYLLGRK